MIRQWYFPTSDHRHLATEQRNAYEKHTDSNNWQYDDDSGYDQAKLDSAGHFSLSSCRLCTTNQTSFVRHASHRLVYSESGSDFPD